MPVADLTALAARALEHLAPLSLGLAAGPVERDAVLRMRFDCVVAEGWARAADHPDGRERDDYDDDRAVYVVGRDGDALVASLRLVFPAPDRPLPTERDFGLRVRPTGRVAEVGRIIVAPAARPGRSHRLLGGLCARAWLELQHRGHDRAVSTAAPDVLDLYRALGMRVTVLGPAQEHWGAPRVPVQVEAEQGAFSFLTA